MVIFDEFKIIPTGYDVGQNNIEAFVYTGTEQLKEIDVTCECFINANSLDWITLVAEHSLLTI